ncbi:glycoside hydrolase family 88 protein [Roseibium sp.]|uniref:glycoside hydrolase family 88/105 protein n=1 Tax=Roseibium sp. TaxID=1936156 RepID=UPI0032649E58
MLTEFFNHYAAAYKPYKGGNWCYEDGLIYRGLELLHMVTGEDRWLAHVKRLADRQILSGPRLAGYNLSEYNIDNVKSGGTLLYLHALTGNAKYMRCAELLAAQLASQPRTRSGVYWHKLRYPWQIWLDGLYMAAPFQIGYAHVSGRQELVADAIAQIKTALRETFVPETGLYAHGVDEARQQKWADRETGRSRAHWARALGWLAMCLVDVADLVGPEAFSPLEAETTALMKRILELQTSSGLWLQVIDAPGLAGNYPEMSASAMFVYALERAQMLGLMSPIHEDLFSRLCKRAVKTDSDGRQYMTGICEVAGLGGFEGTYRDGTSGYYLSEPVVDDDSKGVGPLMMCAALSIMNRKPEQLAAAT